MRRLDICLALAFNISIDHHCWVVTVVVDRGAEKTTCTTAEKDSSLTTRLIQFHDRRVFVNTLGKNDEENSTLFCTNECIHSINTY